MLVKPFPDAIIEAGISKRCITESVSKSMIQIDAGCTTTRPVGYSSTPVSTNHKRSHVSIVGRYTDIILRSDCVLAKSYRNISRNNISIHRCARIDDKIYRYIIILIIRIRTQRRTIWPAGRNHIQRCWNTGSSTRACNKQSVVVPCHSKWYNIAGIVIIWIVYCLKLHLYEKYINNWNQSKMKRFYQSYIYILWQANRQTTFATSRTFLQTQNNLCKLCTNWGQSRYILVNLTFVQKR